MGSASRMISARERATRMLHALLVAAFAFAWIAASGNAHAAKDVSMCAGLKGAAKGLCTAAAALGCSATAKHSAQCDALGDKFEALTGNTPPWEPPPPPPPGGLTVTLLFGLDAFDLDSDTLCMNALGNTCNQSNPVDVVPPNDFWLDVDFAHPDGAIFIPVLDCQAPGITVSVGITTVPFADVTQATPTTPVGSEVAIGPGDTIVIRTCDLNIFKIGNVSIVTDGATVSYEELFF